MCLSGRTGITLATDLEGLVPEASEYKSISDLGTPHKGQLYPKHTRFSHSP